MPFIYLHSLEKSQSVENNAAQFHIKKTAFVFKIKALKKY